MSKGEQNDRTRIGTCLDQFVEVERCRSDGMTWLRIGDPDGSRSKVISLDADEAWALSQALLCDPTSLSESAGEQ